MTSAPQQQISRASLTIAGFSTVVEWYDFTLYLYFATVLARVFFGEGTNSLLDTLAGFAIAYLMRPVGALAFGHLGDRYGRRHMLLASVALMTAAMLGIALLPTREAIGPLAGWALLALRCVMGFAVGGEYTGVVAYLVEGARPERRGLVTSLAAAASEVGGLLAVGLSALTVTLVPAPDLDRWGWRLPFLFGAALAGIVGLARATMEESPEFERQRREGTVPANPLAHVLRHRRAGVARAFAISALGSISYYVGITYVPSFLTSAGRLSEELSLWLATIAAVVVILVTPLVGLASDQVGRRKVLVILALLCAVLPVTMFAWMASGSGGRALLGAVVLAAIAGGVSAVGAAATAEQVGGEGRLTALALGATGATAIFGGLTPWLAHWLVERSGWTLAPGIMIALVALAVLPVLMRLPQSGNLHR